jgi:dienelactone hydrolase
MQFLLMHAKARPGSVSAEGMLISTRPAETELPGQRRKLMSTECQLEWRGGMKKALVAAVLLAICSVGCAPASRELKPTLSDTDAGTIRFASTGSLVPTADGSGYVFGDPIVIAGELRFPSGTGPFPAVILAHGCGGIGNTELGWEKALREWGYATFVMDSFGGRGLVEVCTKATTLRSTQRIPDAYGALRILATHPDIDGRRVALMGFSHGGIMTMEAATAWARETFMPSGKPAFRAFLPFYPYCNVTYPELNHLTAPLRIHTGELDDWTPAEPCVRLVESLKGLGQDAAITVYPGAHHSFDSVGRRLLYLPNVDSGAECFFQIPSLLGPFPLESDVKACLTKGATIAGNAMAAQQARRNVRAQLADLLR